MNGFPVLHGQVHVDVGRTGSSGTHTREPETSVPGARREINEQTRGTQRHVESTSRDVPPTRHQAAGRQMRPTAQTNGTRSGLLPQAYIGTPKGELRSDGHHPQMVVDETGARFVPIGNHFYAVRHDPANNTWRVVQLQEPEKPGIPVELTAAGWRPHARVGLRGGSPNDPRVEAERQSLEYARNQVQQGIASHTVHERQALQLIDSLDQERQRAEDQLREVRNRHEDAAPHERLVDQTKSRLSGAENVLREIRDFLYARANELHDIERSLAQLPPR